MQTNSADTFSSGEKTCIFRYTVKPRGRVGAVKFYPQEQTPGWLLKNKPNPKYPRKKYFVILKKKVLYIFFSPVQIWNPYHLILNKPETASF